MACGDANISPWFLAVVVFALSPGYGCAIDLGPPTPSGGSRAAESNGGAGGQADADGAAGSLGIGGGATVVSEQPNATDGAADVSREMPMACAPSARITCACPGGSAGTQRCRSDGSGFDACDCPPAQTTMGGGAPSACMPLPQDYVCGKSTGATYQACGAHFAGCDQDVDCGGCAAPGDVCSATYKFCCTPIGCGQTPQNPWQRCGTGPDPYCGDSFACGGCDYGTCGIAGSQPNICTCYHDTTHDAECGEAFTDHPNWVMCVGTETPSKPCEKHPKYSNVLCCQ